MQIFAGVRWGGGVKNESVVIENGDFRFILFTVFRTFYIHGRTQLSRDATVDDLGDIRGHYTVSHQISRK